MTLTPAALALLERVERREAEQAAPILPKVPVPKSPRSKLAAMTVYGAAYNPENCVKLIAAGDNWWQCCNKRGRGTLGLYCYRHAVS
jgi:hypothetical protein